LPRNPVTETENCCDVLNSHPRSSISYRKAAVVILEFQSATKKAIGRQSRLGFASRVSRLGRHSTEVYRGGWGRIVVESLLQLAVRSSSSITRR